MFGGLLEKGRKLQLADINLVVSGMITTRVYAYAVGAIGGSDLILAV